MVNTLCALNLLSDILQLHYIDVRLLRLSLKQRIHVVPTPTMFLVPLSGNLILDIRVESYFNFGQNI